MVTRDVADGEGALDEVVVVDGRGELLDRDREVGVLHLSGERLAERTGQTAGTVDVPRAVRLEQGGEERQALDVVPVGVADEEVAVDRLHRPLRAISSTPSPWAPVPQSSTTTVPASERTSTHDVLPPYRSVDGPALAIDPRVPQKVTFMPHVPCQQ